MSPAEIAADARILWRMARGQTAHDDHAARLQAFYAPPAERYDAFRERLLQGRTELIDRLEIGDGMRVVVLGCGTGSSLDRIGTAVRRCACTRLVDLCPALLAVARRRTVAHANVEVIEADATRWQTATAVDAWADERRMLPGLRAPYYLCAGYRGAVAQDVSVTR